MQWDCVQLEPAEPEKRADYKLMLFGDVEVEV